VCEIIVDEIQVTKESDQHTRPAFQKDCKAMIKVLGQQIVFAVHSRQAH